MKFTAPAGQMSAALSMAAMAAMASKKANPPIAIAAADGLVSFSCCGLGVSIKARTEASIEEPGEELVSADKLAGLVAGFPGNSSITLRSATNALMITGGAAKYRLPIYSDPPARLGIDCEIASVDMAAADLLTLLDVVPAAGAEQSRFYLTGIFLENDADRLVAAATDGTKLLRDSVIAGHFSTDPERRLIVPTKAAILVQKLIRATKTQQVTLRRDRALFAVTAPGFEFTTRLVDAVYPEYARVLPKATPNVVTCDRAALGGALIRLAAIADGEPPLLVALAWGDGGPLRVFLPRQPGDANDVITAEASGATRIALSLPQLTDMIGNFDCDRIRLAADGDGPLVLHGDVNKLGVLMSCRWNFRKEDHGANAVA
jgi:DNA polymerase-3 subunit beta